MAKAKVRREKKSMAGLLGGALLFVALLAAYANHFRNGFHYDDGHTIVNNASIRELGNIPLFFRDATTFSTSQAINRIARWFRPCSPLTTDSATGCGRFGFIFHLRPLRRTHATARIRHLSSA